MPYESWAYAANTHINIDQLAPSVFCGQYHTCCLQCCSTCFLALHIGWEALGRQNLAHDHLVGRRECWQIRCRGSLDAYSSLVMAK